MEKEFVPYKLALKMKTLGFDEPCFSWYASENYGLEFGKVVKDNLIQDAVLAPTFSQAFRWFRKNYKLYIQVTNYPTSTNSERTYFQVTSRENVINNDSGEGKHTYISSWYDDYDKAELACLEELIEIIESKSE